jgi:hypothetical protein
MPINSKAAGFFCVDRGAFRCAAAGGLNSAIAHLVMARGTGRDNRTTQWSANAIEKYTGISRPNAKKAVKDLLDRGIWTKTRDGNHPIYEAAPASDIPGGPFTTTEKAIIAAIRDGNRPSEQAVVETLKAREFSRNAPSDAPIISAISHSTLMTLQLQNGRGRSQSGYLTLLSMAQPARFRRLS